MNEVNVFCNAALEYAALGWAVFPLKAGTKDGQLIASWKADATTDTEKIRSWWSKYPDANVAVKCGHASGGLICVDLDEDDEIDEHGAETLRDWEAEHGALPDTWRILTPRGGVHLLFREMPGENIRNRNQKRGGFFPDIDVRGNDGYIVMPPSMVNDKPYEFEYGMDGETKLADVNDTVRLFVHWDKEETGDRKRQNNGGQQKPPYRAADEIPEGCRTSELVAAIASMMAKNYPEDGIRGMIETMNRERCRPPLTDIELKKEVFPALSRDWRPEQPYYKSCKDADSSDFAEFISLEPDLESRLSPFPRGVLPEAIEAHAAAVAESLQVPFDMPALSDLGALSTSAAGNFIVEIKPDWREPPNIYTVLIARPSEKKSPVNKEATCPLTEFVREENERRKPEIAEYQTRKKILSGKIETMRTALTKGKNAAGYTEQDMIDLQIEFDTLEEINELELVLDDVTPEALTRALKRNNERIAIISAEGGIFGLLAGRYSTNPNLDLFLKGYSGEFYASHRVGSGNIQLNHPLLIMCLSVQPQVVRDAMANEEFRGRGLLARFLFSVPESPVGSRVYRTKPIDPQIRQAYKDLIYRLLQLPFLGEGEERVIRLSSEADQLFEAFFYEIEEQLNDELADIEDWAGKLCGQVARIAGLIHIGKNRDPHNTRISAETMEGAIQIGRYFMAHSRRAFDIMGAADPPEVKDAKYMISRLGLNDKNDKIGFVSKRELMRKCQRFKTLAELEPGLNCLKEHGYIRIEAQKNGGKGRPTETIFINPAAME